MAAGPASGWQNELVGPDNRRCERLSRACRWVLLSLLVTASSGGAAARNHDQSTRRAVRSGSPLHFNSLREVVTGDGVIGGNVKIPELEARLGRKATRSPSI